MQVPVPVNDTVEPEIAQTREGYRDENVTGEAGARGRGDGVGRPADVRRRSARVEVKLIVCGPAPTANDCETCGAAE